MPRVELDLRGLAPGTAPGKDDVAGVVDAGSVLVRGPVPALAGVLTALLKAGRTSGVPIAWEPADDTASSALARSLGLGSGTQRSLTLVRDDHGGVLLQHGRLEPWSEDPRRALGRRLGLQAYHDDMKVADGPITRIDVRPEWTAVDTIGVSVMTIPLRPVRRTKGRGLQVASDPALVTRDGVPFPRPVSRWTWFADDRVRWCLSP
jgi:hypothetical protein